MEADTQLLKKAFHRYRRLNKDGDKLLLVATPPARITNHLRLSDASVGCKALKGWVDNNRTF